MNLYLDTSALIKVFILETGYEAVNDWLKAATLTSTCQITRAEIAAACARSARVGKISRQGAWQALREFRAEWSLSAHIKITDSLVSRADELAWQLGLGGYDAIHLAAALTWQDHLRAPITLATFDSELWKAAQVSGLQVLPENFV